MRQRFNAINCIMQFNQIRIEMSNQSATEQDFKYFFKICGIPCNALFWSKFEKSGLIQKIDNNSYIWTNPKRPIHYQELDNIYQEYKNTFDRYYHTYQEKKIKKNTQVLQDAINLLKENGFIILKQEGNMFEQL